MSKEILDTEILDKSMWNMYQTMKDDNFQFDGYSNNDKIMMINHILPYIEVTYDISLNGEYEFIVGWLSGGISLSFKPKQR